MLIFEIPAITVAIVIFIHIALNRANRSKIKNHGWLILIIVNLFQLLIDLPMPMSYYYLETVWPAFYQYCIWWTWCEFSVNAIGLFLMTWISIERHVIIFQPNTILQKPWKKWMFHFIPLILCLIYTPTLYFVLIVISPYCNTLWDFNYISCGSPCYFTTNFLGQFDFIFNVALPVFVIALANLSLLSRVIYQKMSHNQIIRWRNHRKMVIQLWIISSLYMACWLPVTIVSLIQITVIPSFMADQMDVISFSIYLIPLFLPIICLSTFPDLIQKIVNTIGIRGRNIIGIANITRTVEQTATNTNRR
ncbi:unnamed protein product [Rotaria sp. Silwood1]|nr:unnamed protein product [Rotaria sp. Silwood1]CAF3720421.1 unnamed protein product [Rotaria sp. Silwood1]CAF4700164.1 unnamed protein product [Rotaria sp. Silwood1]CAF5020439.1 unnamed protein product [Rotaria sp. Silwood1]